MLIGVFSRKRSSGVVALPSKTAVGILSHRAEPSNLFGENGNPRNFQTGSAQITDDPRGAKMRRGSLFRWAAESAYRPHHSRYVGRGAKKEAGGFGGRLISGLQI